MILLEHGQYPKERGSFYPNRQAVSSGRGQAEKEKSDRTGTVCCLLDRKVKLLL
jgi:hypothetical protein